MEENKTKSPITEKGFYEKEAKRFKRIYELQRMKSEEIPIKTVAQPFLCLKCMWLEGCNGVRIGGCEEFEYKLSAQMK